MQKTDSYQRDLIANVSHDLKTPLTMIKSYAEMINDISGDNQKARWRTSHPVNCRGEDGNQQEACI